MRRSPLGVTVREMDRRFVGRLEIPESVQGVIVQRVDPTGAARQVLDRGFVILEVNRKPTPTVADYRTIVDAAQARAMSSPSTTTIRPLPSARW